MRSIFAIAKYTIIEQIRNRLYLIILFFGGLILGSSLLLGALAPGQSVRVMFDAGLLALELFGLVTAVFGAVTLVMQEVESKTIYLLLTRPLNRTSYVLGRFLGLVLAVAITMISMGALHLLIMVTRGHWFSEFAGEFAFWSIYPTLILMSMGKMLITAAVALFFSLFASSAASALVFTGSFWAAGHFGTELAYVVHKNFHGVAAKVVEVLAAVLPNFQYLNFRDSFAMPKFPGFEFMGWALLYSVAYTAFFLVLSSLLFSRKEF